MYCGHVFCDSLFITCTFGLLHNLKLLFILRKFRLVKKKPFGFLTGDTYTLDMGLI